jgi:hypothetical protein
MVLPVDVVSVEAARKMNTAEGSPPPFKVSVPELAGVPPAVLYVPGVNVRPARSAELN